MTDCPLCTIPDREPLLFENNLIYVVPTKDLKGHTVRVMAVTKRHVKYPSFEERSYAYASLLNYMSKHTTRFYFAAPKTPSIKDHWHLIACDAKFSDLDEMEALHTNPHIKLPLQITRVLIGIPACNEEGTIYSIVKKARQYGEVAVIDDGSTDNTKEQASSAGAKVLSYSSNKGYGTALSDLFVRARNSKVDILITLDADGQHNPDEIPTFINALRSADVVIGNRFLAVPPVVIFGKKGLGMSEMPMHRKVAVKAISKIEGVGDAQCGFRAYNRKAIETILIKNQQWGASLEILQQAKKAKLKIKEIPCTINYNSTDHTQHPLTHGGKLLETILWSRVWMNPFRYLGLLGVISFFLGFVSTLQVMNIYIQYREFVFSWTILSLGGLFGGALLLMTSGIVYLLRRGLEETK